MKCEICKKEIKDEDFKVIQIFNADKEELNGAHFINKEKEFIVCNSCILNLNFKEIKK